MRKTSFTLLIITLFSFTTGPLQAFPPQFFDAALYNSLPGPEENDALIQKFGSLEPVISEIRTYLDERRQDYNDWGLRLIHSHYNVDDGRLPLENFTEYAEHPAYVTQAVDRNSVPVYPASWLSIDGEVSVFEFSSDPRVAKIAETVDEDMIQGIFAVLERYKLDGVLSPAILSRSYNPLSEEDTLFETTYRDGENYFSVVTASSDAKNSTAKNIRTSWNLMEDNSELRCNHPKNWYCKGTVFCRYDDIRNEHLSIYDHETIKTYKTNISDK